MRARRLDRQRLQRIRSNAPPVSIARLIRENRQVVAFEEQFGQAALYLLAAPSAPEEAREEAIVACRSPR